MKTNSRARCSLNITRWASYTLAGTATLVAANDAEAQILYSGTLNHVMGNTPFVIHTLTANSHQGVVAIGQFSHHRSGATSGTARFKPNPVVNAGVGGFYASNNATHSRFGYASNLPAGHAINGLNFNVNPPGTFRGLLAGTFYSGGDHLASAQFRAQANGQYLAFEFNKGGAGLQYGWARVNMTTGAPMNAFTVVDYAYGAVGQTITVGESVLPLPTWTGVINSNWDTPANWSTGIVPGANNSTGNTDTAYFSQMFTNEPAAIDLKSQSAEYHVQYAQRPDTRHRHRQRQSVAAD